MYFATVLSCCLLLSSALAVKFDITNRDGGEIWVGIQGNSGKQHLENGGFKLGQGQTRSVEAPGDWGGRFWSRQWCDGNNCAVGNCGGGVQCNGRGGTPPVTLVEITLNGWQGQDFYDISLVDGYSSPATITPIGGQGKCKALKCLARINDNCPNDLKLNTPHGVLGCKSACTRWPENDLYCCRNAHGTKETCNTNEWAVNSAKYFKEKCPDAYSYAYDDDTSTFTCKAQHYAITFGG